MTNWKKLQSNSSDPTVRTEGWYIADSKDRPIIFQDPNGKYFYNFKSGIYNIKFPDGAVERFRVISSVKRNKWIDKYCSVDSFKVTIALKYHGVLGDFSIGFDGVEIDLDSFEEIDWDSL